MNRFHDCESCAFSGIEEAVCDTCEDSDQWEPSDPDGEIITTTRKSVRIMKYYGKKKAV